RPDLTQLVEQRNACRQKVERYRLLHEQMHRAMANQDWTEALRQADEVLELAPQCRLAREARRRAWSYVGAKVPDSQRLGLTSPWNGAFAKLDGAKADAVPAKPRAGRFLLWIDAVGGY